ATDPNAPAADEISFVVMGDANRGVFKQLRGTTLPVFNYAVPELPETKYKVVVVAGEYDGIGDWPDRSWNLLADFNALAGTGLLQQVIPENIVNALGLEGYGSVHYDAMFADLTQVPTGNVTVTVNPLGGVTTTYLVPTADLPMLRPLQTLGVPQAAIDAFECVLRPIIDSAYVRNDPPWLQKLTAAAKPTTVVRPRAARSAAVSSPTARRDTRTAAQATGNAGTRRASGPRSTD
ncbi:MAG: PE-PPE domain-containing protein, partial [Mycobacterium sp.]